MNMGISIKTTDIQLGVDRTPSVLNIESGSAKLRLHQNHAQINISTDHVRVIIDQYRCFAEAGLKNNYDFAKEAAVKGLKQSMKFIARTAEDGNRLAEIEKGGNPVAEIAERRAFPQKQFVLDFIPKSRPEIKVEGNVDIELNRRGDLTRNGVDGDYIPAWMKINYTPSRVDIYVKQYPSVEIKYEKSIDVLI